MKKPFTSSILTSLLLVFSLSAVSTNTAVLALDESSNNQTASNSETTSTDDSQKTMQERLTKYKTNLKLRLTNLEQTHIKARCKSAQTGGVKRLSGRIHGIETSRDRVYDNLVNRLNKLVDKLKAKNVDTTTLEAEITTLKTKIATFKTDLATYKQNVSDLEGMDCSSDPTAFKSALETARTGRQKLIEDGKDIKTYLNDTIKPTLKDIRSQLESQEKESETNESSNNTEGGQ